MTIIHIAAREPGYAICGWDRRKDFALVGDLTTVTCRFCLKLLRLPDAAVLSEREACARIADERGHHDVAAAIRAR